MTILRSVFRALGTFRWPRRFRLMGSDPLSVELRDGLDPEGVAPSVREAVREAELPGPGGTIHMELVRGRWRDRFLGAFTASVLIFLMGLGFIALIDIFVAAPSQRGWVVLGLMYYIGTIWQNAVNSLRLILGRNQYIRVVVDRMSDAMLFEAITARLEALAEKEPEDLASRDVEAFTHYDPARSESIVKFNFWGTRPRQFSFRLKPGSDNQSGRSPIVTVEYNYGDNVVCGRDSHLERNRSMVLWIRTSPTHVAEDKLLLRRWCDSCVGVALEPPPNRVEVYGLQESSSDWVPEWKLERTKSLKSSVHSGDCFYLERSCFSELYADAKIWSRRSLRLYMVTGPPGVGKTEFTVWLAGCLKLPIYRLSLTMGSLTDARLAQLLAQNMMKHETVVVQIDEFQEVLRRWDSNGKGISITPGGFNEVLQGSTTLAKGIIVLTGTADVASVAHQRAYPALFRRFQIQIALGYLEVEDAGRFFRSFLMEFVDNSEAEWQAWEAQFCACLRAHGPPQLSVDMVKQYLMRRLTAACAGGLLTASPGSNAKFQAVSRRRDELAGLLMQGAAVEAFFQAYVGGDSTGDTGASGLAGAGEPKQPEPWKGHSKGH